MRLVEARLQLPLTAAEARNATIYAGSRYAREHRFVSSVTVPLASASASSSPSSFYTKRVIRLGSAPAWIERLVGDGLTIVEEAWSDGDLTRFIVRVPALASRLTICIDMRAVSQAFELSAAEVARREFHLIDLCPHASAEKSFVHYLLRVNFEQWGLKTTMEDYVVSEALNLWTKMLRQALEWKPDWSGLELEDLIGAEASKRTVDEEIQLPKIPAACYARARRLAGARRPLRARL